MLFTIHAIDKPGMDAKRAEVIDAHRDYLAGEPIQVVMSGPLMSDDESKPIGSFFIVEAESRAQVEAFQAADPLVQADIFEQMNVQVFHKRVG